MLKKRFVFLIVMIFEIHLIYGQVDTTIVIDDVEVSATSIRSNEIGKFQQFWSDSASFDLSGNVSNLLQSKGNVYIKNYGPGSLSTPSIRGGSAAHTLVLWNDLPIQSPSLGVLDFSLLPLSSFSTVTLQKGGNSTSWGSGAVSSTIQLQSKEPFSQRNHVQFGLTGGSWNSRSYHGQVQTGNEKIQAITKVSYQSSNNDFNYSISPTLPVRVLQNAQFAMTNVMQDVHWKIHPRHLISIHSWYQTADRGIPPLTTQSVSAAQQQDEAKRVMLRWKSIGDNWIINSRMGYFNEDNNYQDSILGVNAKNHFERYLFDSEIEQSFNSIFRGLVGFSHIRTQARSSGYNLEPEESRTAIHISLKAERKKWKVQMGSRQEWIDGKNVPLTPYVSGEFSINNDIRFTGNIHKVYRTPTLNDKYWAPGGNLNLLAEQGWSYELGGQVSQSWSNTLLMCKSNFYTRKIKDWILWAPLEGQLFFSANNIATVWSRGAEQNVEVQVSHQGYKFVWVAQYDYTLSTNEISLEQPKIAKGEQLLYTPVHNASLSANVISGDWRFGYSHRFVGATHGVNEDIPSYNFGGVAIGCTCLKKDHNISFDFKVDNIWNSNYVIVERRPMPGRNYTLEINYRINNIL